MSPLALTVRAFSRGQLSRSKLPAVVEKPLLTYALAQAAAGELVVDKLPQTPSRTFLPSQLGRAVTGAAAGAMIADAAAEDPRVGAIAGGAGALVGTHLGYFLRTKLTERLPLPAFVVALLEDLVAVGGTLLVLRSVSREEA